MNMQLAPPGVMSVVKPVGPLEFPSPLLWISSSAPVAALKVLWSMSPGPCPPVQMMVPGLDGLPSLKVLFQILKAVVSGESVVFITIGQPPLMREPVNVTPVICMLPVVVAVKDIMLLDPVTPKFTEVLPCPFQTMYLPESEMLV